ncbi:MAG TPA: hypothetical protein VIM90_04555 [Arenimonas sp.]
MNFPDWLHYDPLTDVLTIHGKRYDARIFGEARLLGPPGTVLRVEEGPGDVVTLTNAKDLELAVAQAVEFATYVEEHAKGKMEEAARRFLSMPFAQELAGVLKAGREARAGGEVMGYICHSFDKPSSFRLTPAGLTIGFGEHPVYTRSPADQSGWQPIDTAPLDGTAVLLFGRYWADGQGWMKYAMLGQYLEQGFQPHSPCWVAWGPNGRFAVRPTTWKPVTKPASKGEG